MIFNATMACAPCCAAWYARRSRPCPISASSVQTGQARSTGPAFVIGTPSVV
ncbi:MULTISPECIES: hypothetical protein [Actinomadura]|uniref:hypothetical protein n=1 Tax=Actinomadura TaxID=1988 RepID=UPI0031EEA7E5